ncbi:MAG: DUF4292 domain-containing protein [Acidobacteriaceae bacterium]|nr:DUF4292 domain-containing protein [Acidobacteriaceae bacterium]
MTLKSTVSVALAMTMLGVSSGCFRSTKLVQKTMAPDVYHSASVEALEKDVQDRDAAIKTLNAGVLITATVGGGKTGQVTTYTSFRGYIFVRKPEDLRVIMQLPVIGSRALDMVSNGKTFTLVHATAGHGDVWMHGSNTVTTPSKNGLENLRPGVFLDSLLVPGVAANEFVSLNESTRIMPSPDKKRVAIEEPDYDLTISKVKSGNVLQTTRVLHISRITMLPFQQDIYDNQGRVVTSALYENYKDFNGVQFPMTITMKRPLDEYSLKVDVTKLTVNAPFDDDQFELAIPAGVTVQEMK